MRMCQLLGAALLALVAGRAMATQCPQHYADGAAPTIQNKSLATATREICFAGFGVLHSGVARTPLWSAQHLTRQRIKSARTMKRIDSFHAEASLAPSERAELNDYSRTGFQRGHLSPNADQDRSQTQFESFSLANIVPQVPTHNQQTWEQIERATRRYVVQHGDTYVITGVLHLSQRVQRLHNRVLVPTHLYKAIYNPSHQAAAAYLSPNDDSGEYRVVSIAELEQLAGINLFPSLSSAVKSRPARLPPPEQRRHKPQSFF